MTNQELIKELELLVDSCDSNYALEVNGYSRGVLDALDVVNKYFVLVPVSGALQINWDDVYEEANHRSPTSFDEYVKGICNDR